MVQGNDRRRKALACDVAAILEEKDVMNANEVYTSLLLRVTALRDARRNRHLGPWGRIAKIAAEYARMANVDTDNSYVDGEEIGALVASGYPERIAMAMGHNGDYRLANGSTVSLAPDDPLARLFLDSCRRAACGQPRTRTGFPRRAGEYQRYRRPHHVV